MFEAPLTWNETLLRWGDGPSLGRPTCQSLCPDGSVDLIDGTLQGDGSPIAWSPTTASQSDSQSSLAAVIGGAIAAAAVVLLIVVLVLAVVVVLVVRQKRSKSTAALNGKERGKVGSQ